MCKKIMRLNRHRFLLVLLICPGVLVTVGVGVSVAALVGVGVAVPSEVATKSRFTSPVSVPL